MEQVLQLILDVPHLPEVLIIMGAMRVVFKPLMATIQAYVDYTETLKDNELLDRLQQKGWFKAVAWVLDYVGSIKLPKKN